MAFEKLRISFVMKYQPIINEAVRVKWVLECWCSCLFVLPFKAQHPETMLCTIGAHCKTHELEENPPTESYRTTTCNHNMQHKLRTRWHR